MRWLLVVAGLLLAGCTAADSGTPTVGDSPSETTTTTTTTSAASSRPKDIDMAAVDICGLVGSLPRAEFGLDADRPPTGGESSLFPGSQDCFANGIENNLGLLIVAVVDQGAAEFVDGANAEIGQTDANGFPLYVLTPASQSSCFGALDVNDGQMLYLSYAVGSADSPPVTPQVTLCQRIPDIARAALALL